MIAKRTDKEARPIPGMPPRAPTYIPAQEKRIHETQAMYDSFFNEDLRRTKIDFEKDMEIIKEAALKKVDKNYEARMKEIRKHGAFKERTW